MEKSCVFSNFIFMHKGPAQCYERVFESLPLYAVSYWRSSEGITDVCLMFEYGVDVWELVRIINLNPEISMIRFELGEFFLGLPEGSKKTVSVPERTVKEAQFPRRKDVELEGSEMIHRMLRVSKLRQREYVKRTYEGKSAAAVALSLVDDEFGRNVVRVLKKTETRPVLETLLVFADYSIEFRV